MFFPFGIEKEAEIYLASSKLGLQIDPQANGVINHLRNAFLEEDKVDLLCNFVERMFSVRLTTMKMRKELHGLSHCFQRHILLLARYHVHLIHYS